MQRYHWLVPAEPGLLPVDLCLKAMLEQAEELLVLAQGKKVELEASL